jgi:hypothetical protein
VPVRPIRIIGDPVLHRPTRPVETFDGELKALVADMFETMAAADGVELGIHSLSAVNMAGVSAQGKGPALSLNTGDNDGFYSMDGGKSWTYQQYGGGDNDCSYADPLRPRSSNG